jgi:beta-lactamase regulating signal transducer with metallopeptidase domain
MLLSVLLPVFMMLRAEPTPAPLPVVAPAPEPVVATAPDSGVEPAPAAYRSSTPSIAPTPGAIPHALEPAPQAQPPAAPQPRDWHLPLIADRTLLQIWTVTALLAGLYLMVANLRLRRRIPGWQPTTLHGHAVLVSESMGPALIGAWRPRMVIPRWLLDGPVATQSLVLEHERQHIAARDPLLIRAGVLLLAAMPWNLPLWWVYMRMRQAIELDCDARVLATGAEPRSYGEVLLAIAGRSPHMPAGMVAMSEPVSALERRIQNLLPDPMRLVALQVGGACMLLATGVGMAIAMDAPALRSPAAAVVLAAQPAAELPASTSPASNTSSTSPASPAAASSAPATMPRPGVAEPGSRQRVAVPLPATAADPTGTIPLEELLRMAVQKYPQLVAGPTSQGSIYFQVMMVVRADGAIEDSVLLEYPPAAGGSGTPETVGSGAMAGVVNLVLNHRLEGIFLHPDGGIIEVSKAVRIRKGEPIADLGVASRDIDLKWRVLPADSGAAREVGTGMPTAGTVQPSIQRAQELVNVTGSASVRFARWTKQPDAYVLLVATGRNRAPAPNTGTATSVPAASAPVPKISEEELKRQGTANVTDALAMLMPQNLSAYMPAAPGAPAPNTSGSAQDRADYTPHFIGSNSFIGPTIENLRGMDPVFCGRTLTLVDGRRKPGAPDAAAPGTAGPGPQSTGYKPRTFQPYRGAIKVPNVEAWLLKADGTQIEPAAYKCDPGPSDTPPAERLNEISYAYPVEQAAQAVAVAIRINQEYFIEKLQPLQSSAQ